MPATATAEPTFDQLVSMAQEIESEEVTIITPEPKAKAPKPETKEKPKEAAPETARETRQDEADDDEPLPEGVRKRIEKEARRAADIQAKIDQAVSSRKAKEKELESLTGKQGSEPEKQTAPKKDERPKPPILATFQGSLAEFETAQQKYADDLEQYLEGKTRATVTEELTARQEKEAHDAEWARCAKKYGSDFPQKMDLLAKELPVALQKAVSAVGKDEWGALALHLLENNELREEIVALYKSDLPEAIIRLGELRKQLTPEAKAAKPEDDEEEEERLPKPTKVIGGGGRSAPKVKQLHEMIGRDGDVTDFLSEVTRLSAKTA